MDKFLKYVFWIAFIAVVGSLQVSAYVTDPHINEKWRIIGGQDVGAIAVGDTNGDGFSELVVGYEDNTVKIYNNSNKPIKQFKAGSLSQRGEIRSLEVGALRLDGSPKILIGYTSKLVNEEVDSPEYYNDKNISMVRFEKRLIKRVRREGGIAVYNAEGVEEWFYPTPDGVHDLALEDLDFDGEKEIIAGIGELSSLVYNEKTGEDDNGIGIWEDIEYFYKNGTVLALTSQGERIWEYHIYEYDKKGDIENLDYQVRSLYTSDLEGKGLEKNILAGSNIGKIYVLNRTGEYSHKISVGARIFDVEAQDIEGYRQMEVLASSADNRLRFFDSYGVLVWAYKFPGFPQTITIKDIDFDEIVDIVVGSSDGNIYILNQSGTKRWEYKHTEPIYDMIIFDMDRNGNAEIVIEGAGNVTVLELREDYVKMVQAEGFYLKAKKHMDIYQDYVNARIYAQKTKTICEEIGDDLCLNRVNVLLVKLREILAQQIIIRGDHLYEEAVKAYGLDNYTLALDYLIQAKTLYLEVNHQDGIENCNLLEERISTEICVKAELEANTFYAQGLNYFGYQNMTGALKMAREARRLYQNISESCNKDKSDGIINANKVIANVASNYYRKSETYYNSRDCNTALVWVKESILLYEEVLDTEGSLKGQILQKRAQELCDNPAPNIPVGYGDIFFIAIIGVITIILLIIYKKVQRGRGDEF
ncbi:MAG: VCBS repeat-containing protein [Candidatus Altiarchaeota archaeon]